MTYRTTVSAVIQHSKTKKYLLVKQPPNIGAYPGLWAIPGGGIEPGETMTDALKRECREEVGLDITNIHPFRFSDTTREKRLSNGTTDMVYMILLVFTCDTDSDRVTIDQEADDFAWVNLPDIFSYQLNQPTKETFEQLIQQNL